MHLFRRKKYREWAQGALVGVVLLFVVPAFERVTAPIALVHESGIMTLSVFDVGQGDAILAQEGEYQILIDGGPDDTVLEKLGTVMPPGDRTIDLVVLTHPHADHVTGLVNVLERYNVNKVLTTDVTNSTLVFREWNEQIQDKKIPVADPQVVTEERVGKMTYTILTSGTSTSIIGTDHLGNSGGFNDSSIVGMLYFGEVRFLLMGDATMEIEKKLVEAKPRQPVDKVSPLKADFLKIGHHGSAYSTSEAFLTLVAPRFAAISVGARNTYGHPAWRVTELLKRLGITTYRTDEQGDMVAITDGHALQMTTERVP